MSVGLESSILQVESAKSIWESVRQATPSFIMNGVTIDPRHIDRGIDDVIRFLNIAEQQDNPDMAMVAVHLPGVTSQCQQLANHAIQLRANPSGYLPHIVSTLWGIRSSMLWLLPAGAAVLESWPLRSAEIQETLQSISKTYSEAVKRVEEIRLLQDKFKALDDALPSVKELSSEINKVLQEATSAKASAEGSASNAAAKNEEASRYTKILDELVAAQRALFDHFETRKDEIDSTLEGASKVGLASSFNKQEQSHKIGRQFWSRAFYWGIIAMVMLEVMTTFFPEYFPKLTNETWLSWVVSRVAIISPVIWFTWFSALQYSRAMRLEQDYAFKSASAQSFYGYRKEMGADEELLNLLRETSIKNFGANPIRVLGTNDHGTPMQEVFEKLTSKIDTDVLVKFADALKEYAEKTKGK